MKNNSIWGRLAGIIAGVVYIGFGLLMIQNPSTTLKTLSIVMAWVVLISGIAIIAMGYMFNNLDKDISRSNIADGVLLLILGLIFMFGSFINNTLILAYLLIIWIIMDSAFQLQLTAFIPRTGLRLVVMALDVFVIAFAIWLLFNPGEAEGFLVLYTGFAFISTGIGKFLKTY